MSYWLYFYNNFCAWRSNYQDHNFSSSAPVIVCSSNHLSLSFFIFSIHSCLISVFGITMSTPTVSSKIDEGLQHWCFFTFGSGPADKMIFIEVMETLIGYTNFIFMVHRTPHLVSADPVWKITRKTSGNHIPLEYSYISAAETTFHTVNGCAI